jgi:hypothetical protein
MALLLVERNNIVGLSAKQSVYVAPIIFHTDVLRLRPECRDIYIIHKIMLNIVLKTNKT